MDERVVVTFGAAAVLVVCRFETAVLAGGSVDA